MPTESLESRAAIKQLPVSFIAFIWRGAMYPAAPIMQKFFKLKLRLTSAALIHNPPHSHGIRKTVESTLIASPHNHCCHIQTREFWLPGATDPLMLPDCAITHSRKQFVIEIHLSKEVKLPLGTADKQEPR